MDTKEEFKKWIYTYHEKLFKQLLSLHRTKKYYISSDEGGMMGTPRFSISDSEVVKPYFEPIAYMNKYHICNYIVGRIATWMLDGKDYSSVTQITIE